VVDLYKTLGVNRNASSKGIQNAFRRLVKKHHPDRGGDPEKFREVQEAYDVLSDPERRSRYDATGDTSKKVDNREALLALAVSRAYALLLDKVLSTKRDLTTIDVVGEMKSLLDAKIRETEESLPELRKVMNNLSQVADRLTDEQGLLIGAAQFQVTNLGRQIEQFQKELDEMKLAHDYLNRCAYDFDKRPDERKPARSGFELQVALLEALMKGARS